MMSSVPGRIVGTGTSTVPRAPAHRQPPGSAHCLDAGPPSGSFHRRDFPADLLQRPGNGMRHIMTEAPTNLCRGIAELRRVGSLLLVFLGAHIESGRRHSDDDHPHVHQAPVQAELADLEAMARDSSLPQAPRHLDRSLWSSEQTIRGDAAGFLLSCGDQPTVPVTAADRATTRANMLQVDLRQGPGSQAMARRQPVISPSCALTAGDGSGRRSPRSRFPVGAGAQSHRRRHIRCVEPLPRRPSRFDSADSALAQASPPTPPLPWP